MKVTKVPANASSRSGFDQSAQCTRRRLGTARTVMIAATSSGAISIEGPFSHRRYRKYVAQDDLAGSTLRFGWLHPSWV